MSPVRKPQIPMPKYTDPNEPQLSAKLVEVKTRKAALKQEVLQMANRIGFLEDACQRDAVRLEASKRLQNAFEEKRKTEDEKKMIRSTRDDILEHEAAVKKLVRQDEAVRKRKAREKMEELFQAKKSEVDDLRQGLTKLKELHAAERQTDLEECRTQARAMRQEQQRNRTKAYEMQSHTRSSLFEARKAEQQANEQHIKSCREVEMRLKKDYAHTLRETTPKWEQNFETLQARNRKVMQDTFQHKLAMEELEIGYYLSELKKMQEQERVSKRRLDDTQQKLRRFGDLDEGGTLSPLATPSRRHA